MGRARALAGLVLVAAAGCAGAAGGGGAFTTPPLPLVSPPSAGAAARGIITHVVVIVQENRTFDNLFGGFPGGPQAYPGADSAIPANAGLPLRTTTFASDPPHNPHDWFRCLQVNDFSPSIWSDYASGIWPVSPQPCPTSAPPANPDTTAGAEPEALWVVDDLHRLTYWNIADSYELGDRYFAIQDADSFAGHQYIVALQSLNDLDEVIDGTPDDGTQNLASCGSVESGDAVKTPVFDLNTGFTHWQFEGTSGTCWNGVTFGDRLNAAKVDWKHYSTDTASGVFDGFINFQPWYLQTKGIGGSHFRRSLDDLPADIAAGTLPAFAWVKPPCVALSDHPGRTHDPFGGQNWIAGIVNAIGSNDALWKHTVIFVVWDDWGGFYDHVAPAQASANPVLALTPGMRQPFLVISAYGHGRGYVSHATANYGSVIKFVDDLDRVTPLNALDSAATDLSDFFDFSKAPDSFTRIVDAEAGISPATACGRYIGIKPYDVDR